MRSEARSAAAMYFNVLTLSHMDSLTIIIYIHIT
jgi:hypothetical protein